MPGGAKIATCCYCGTRAALVLSGDVRHELACASCGAPLHDMKMFPGAEASHGKAQPKASAAKPRASAPELLWETPRRQPPRPKGKKLRKSLGRRFLKEAFDAIEDIFD